MAMAIMGIPLALPLSSLVFLGAFIPLVGAVIAGFFAVVVALIANWKTQRRRLLLGALTLFLVGGIVAGLFLEPGFAELRAAGYSDTVDAELQRRAATWYVYDCGVWLLGLIAGVCLLVALARPAMDHRGVTGLGTSLH